MQARSSSAARSSCHSASSRSRCSSRESVDAQEQRLPRRSSRRRRTRARTRSMSSLEEPGPSPEQSVVVELVVAAAHRGHAQDDQLGVDAGELPARHQPAGEVQPAPEQPVVATQRGEDARRAGAGDPSGEPAEQPDRQPDLTQAAGRDARGGHASTLRAWPTSGSTRLAARLSTDMARTYAGGQIPLDGVDQPDVGGGVDPVAVASYALEDRRGRRPPARPPARGTAPAPCGTAGWSCPRRRSGRCSVSGVCTAPGQTSETPMPCRARSKRSTSETPRRPNLLALYAACHGIPMIPAAEETLTR